MIFENKLIFSLNLNYEILFIKKYKRKNNLKIKKLKSKLNYIKKTLSFVEI